MIGISSLATDHFAPPKLMAALRESGLGHIWVVVGGIVPDDGVSGIDGHCAYCPARDDIVSTIAGLAVAARAMAN